MKEEDYKKGNRRENKKALGRIYYLESWNIYDKALCDNY